MNILENYSPETIEQAVKLLKFKAFVESLYREDTPENNKSLDYLLEGVNSIIEAYVPSNIIKSYLSTDTASNSIESLNDQAKKILAKDNSEETQARVVAMLMKASIKLVSTMLNNIARKHPDITAEHLEDAVQEFALRLTSQVKKYAENIDTNPDADIIEEKDITPVVEKATNGSDIETEETEETEDENEDIIEEPTTEEVKSKDVLNTQWFNNWISKSMHKVRNNAKVKQWTTYLSKTRNGFRPGTVVYFNGKYYMRTTPLDPKHPDYLKTKGIPPQYLESPPSSETVLNKYWVETAKPGAARSTEMLDPETGDVIGIREFDKAAEDSKERPVGNFDADTTDYDNKMMRLVDGMDEEIISDAEKEIETAKDELLIETDPAKINKLNGIIERAQKRIDARSRRKEAVKERINVMDKKDSLEAERKTFPLSKKQIEKLPASEKERYDVMTKEKQELPTGKQTQEKHGVNLKDSMLDLFKEYVDKNDLSRISPQLLEKMKAKFPEHLQGEIGKIIDKNR